MSAKIDQKSGTSRPTMYRIYHIKKNTALPPGAPIAKRIVMSTIMRKVSYEYNFKYNSSIKYSGL